MANKYTRIWHISYNIRGGVFARILVCCAGSSTVGKILFFFVMHFVLDTIQRSAIFGSMITQIWFR